jgi:predicted nucleic acid-binding protein
VLAAITRPVCTGEANPDETTARCRNRRHHVHAGALTLLPEADILDDAIGLTLTVRHNLQDCLYLAAARRLGAELITADPTFVRRVGPHYGRVSLLHGCEPH